MYIFSVSPRCQGKSSKNYLKIIVIARKNSINKNTWLLETSRRKALSGLWPVTSQYMCGCVHLWDLSGVGVWGGPSFLFVLTAAVWPLVNLVWFPFQQESKLCGVSATMSSFRRENNRLRKVQVSKSGWLALRKVQKTQGTEIFRTKFSCKHKAMGSEMSWSQGFSSLTLGHFQNLWLYCYSEMWSNGWIDGPAESLILPRPLSLISSSVKWVLRQNCSSRLLEDRVRYTGHLASIKVIHPAHAPLVAPPGITALHSSLIVWFGSHQPGESF